MKRRLLLKAFFNELFVKLLSNFLMNDNALFNESNI